MQGTRIVQLHGGVGARVIFRYPSWRSVTHFSPTCIVFWQSFSNTPESTCSLSASRWEDVGTVFFARCTCMFSALCEQDVWTTACACLLFVPCLVQAAGLFAAPLSVARRIFPDGFELLRPRLRVPGLRLPRLQHVRPNRRTATGRGRRFGKRISDGTGHRGGPSERPTGVQVRLDADQRGGLRIDHGRFRHAGPSHAHELPLHRQGRGQAPAVPQEEPVQAGRGRGSERRAGGGEGGGGLQIGQGDGGRGGEAPRGEAPPEPSAEDCAWRSAT